MTSSPKAKTMKRAGKILGEVLEEVLSEVRPGITETEIDHLAEKLILKKGGEPGFKKVTGYKHTICISTNDVVVHGIPTARKLHAGDVVGIDCGVYLDGYHTDMAETIKIKNLLRSRAQDRGEKSKIKSSVDDKIDTFLRIGKEAMFAGIAEARVGAHVGDVSHAIQDIVEGEGFSIVRSLVGHGVGKQLHEQPEIPGYLAGPIAKTPLLTAGMTIAVEVIYNMGKEGVVYTKDDDWTIVSEDGTLSGLFERTILITEKGPELITSLTSDRL